MTTVEPVMLLSEDSIVVVPIGEKIIKIGIRGGSGKYTVMKQPHVGCEDVSMTKNFLVLIGNDCEGQVVVGDKYNVLNFATVTVTRSDIGGSLQVELLGSGTVDTFLGYEIPFSDFVIAKNINDNVLMYNCSSLVSSVQVGNHSIASVTFKMTDHPMTCGKILVEPKLPGKTQIDILSSFDMTSGVSIPLTVHSPFIIHPASYIFNQSLPVISVNASIQFTVSGGSLSRIYHPEPITVTNPWVADVKTVNNTFRLTCRMIGKTAVEVTHSPNSRIDVECVEPESAIIVTSDTSTSGVSKDGELFVTCGHGEDHL